MNADLYFDIGKSHTVCQDYSKLTTIGDRVAVFLSDGCSSSPHTDYGARFLCTAAARQWVSGEFKDAYPIILRAHAMSEMAGLPQESLDATLLAAYSDGDNVEVRMWGDGVVAARERHTRRIYYLVVESPKGAPDYPSYMLDRDRQNNWFTYVTGARKMAYINDPDVAGDKAVELLPFEALKLSFPASLYDLVTLMSDGAQSFQKKDERGGLHTIPVEDVVAHVMNIRGNVGEFVVRTVRNVFLNRHCPQNNWTHYDDFTAASIFIPEPDAAPTT